MNYADIILPQATGSYTYSIPEHLKGVIRVGMRVEVPLGSRVAIGVVRKISEILIGGNSSKIKSIRAIAEPLNEPQTIQAWYIEFIEWMAQYYMVPIGEVYRALVPSFFRKGLTGRNRIGAIRLNPSIVINNNIHTNPQSNNEPSDMGHGASQEWQTELKRSKAQLIAMQKLIDLYSGYFLSIDNNCGSTINKDPNHTNNYYQQTKQSTDNRNQAEIVPYISKSYATNKLEINNAILSKLRERNYIEFCDVLPNEVIDMDKSVLISNSTQKTYDTSEKSSYDNQTHTDTTKSQIIDSCNQINLGLRTNQHHIALLTEQGYNTKLKASLLAELIRTQTKQGKLTIIITPDTLTSQWMESELNHLLNETNGSSCRIGTFSSRHGESSRRNVFYGAQDGAYDLLIGTRGLLFQPYDSLKLGLIIVDQEENFAYKNSDSAPRYNAKDVAIMLGKWCSADVLLVSQSPSIESYAMARGGKWHYQTIDYRTITNNDCITINNHNNQNLANKITPLFKILDRGKGLLSGYLLRRIKETTDMGKQVIIFQNRRGYAGYTECQECFFTPSCPHCSVSLTYHMSSNSMLCHYCGFSTMPISRCPACGSDAIKQSGIGTQRLEQDLGAQFPDLKISRLDTDNAQKKGALEEITYDFANQNSDIMVGTQLMLNGLDFSNVALVCIANADSMLMNNDFRASERAFALLTQLSNRINNNNQDSEIIIQTSKQNNPIIINAIKGELDRFYAQELEQRQKLHYPPSVRMMTIVMSSESLMSLNSAVKRCEQLLRPIFGNRLSPSYEPPVARIANRHYIHQMLRIERSRSIIKAKEILNTAINTLQQEHRDVRIYVDVDPI